MVRDERGAVMIWTAVSLGLLVALAGLATDVPYLYAAKRQAQTAADAGALAGANGLFVGTAQAVADARAIARRTRIIGQALTDAQVQVDLVNSAGAGAPDQVRCTVFRDTTRGNPLQLFLLPMLQLYGLGRTTADVSATATARITNSCGSDCFKPWSIADRWIDMNGNGRFDLGVDRYVPPGMAGATGYQYPGDRGLELTLKEGTPGGTIVPSFFNAVDFPPINRGTPITGAGAYRDNIAICAPQSFVSIGDRLQVEPGNKSGPTRQGVQALIDQDPTAVWDPGCQCVLNSRFSGNSPRLVRIAFFDPRFGVRPGRNDLTVVNVGGFFIVGVRANGDVTGRFTLVPSFGGAPAPAGSACTFLRTVQLVQ